MYFSYNTSTIFGRKRINNKQFLKYDPMINTSDDIKVKGHWII